MRKHYRLKCKKRFIMFLAAFIALLFCIFFFTLQQTQSMQMEQYVEVVVVQGDTLWGIADRVYRSTQDIRKAVREIRKANNLETSYIQPGQTIRVPLR